MCWISPHLFYIPGFKVFEGFTSIPLFCTYKELRLWRSMQGIAYVLVIYVDTLNPFFRQKMEFVLCSFWFLKSKFQISYDLWMTPWKLNEIFWDGLRSLVQAMYSVGKLNFQPLNIWKQDTLVCKLYMIVLWGKLALSVSDFVGQFQNQTHPMMIILTMLSKTSIYNLHLYWWSLFVDYKLSSNL